VILDMAGTIVDYGSCAPAGVFIELFRRHGIPITTAQARAPMGAHKRDHIAAIAAMPEVADAWRAANGRDAADSDIKAMYRELIPLQLAALPAYSALIPGTLEAVADFRRRGLGVATTTGYNREMTDVVLQEMARQGFEPDAAVCVDDVPAGRPEPWMALEAAKHLRSYPPAACVKVGDTVPDVLEGLNAGMWTVALTRTGNELGLTQAESEALPRGELRARLERATTRLRSAGAHFVVESIADLPPVLDEISRRLASADKP
jgi:phosphonoacetaldehyde hydrolase